MIRAACAYDTIADVTTPLDVRAMLDPEIAEALAQFPIDLGQLNNESLGLIRELLGSAPPLPLTDLVERSDHALAGRPGASVRLHRPIGVEGPMPCVYWMHGGGLVLGTNVGDDDRFDRWCTTFGCVGVSVEYGLAPENPYPGPLDDCYAGLRWVHDNAASFGIDTTRIGIGGASAGGGLAAALALLARDRGELDVAFQLLVYPMIDDRQITASSAWIDPVWPPAANRFGWDAYLGGLTGDDVPHYAAAARAEDLAGLPSTFIAVGALDGFSDEDVAYATRLRHAGVPVELHVYPGAPHGFDAITAHTAVAVRAVNHMEDWLGTALGVRTPNA